MSLLIVRVPLKPFSGNNASSPSDWQDLACAEQFEWCLLESIEGANLEYQTGIGSTDSMPYADQALVLMPTLDVRLIEAKVPLANSKKLQQILPNLVEEYLLAGAESLAVQAFPPIPGKPVLQRTLGLIDRAWLAWLTRQLEVLLCPRVRLIPDCLMLEYTDSVSTSVGALVAPSIAFQRIDGNVILTQRTGEQLGVGWVERENIEQGITLPSSLGKDQAVEMSWEWLALSAQAFIKANMSSKSANFSLNLLPRNFRKQINKPSLRSSLFGFTRLLGVSGQFENHTTDTGSKGMSWVDPVLWRRPQQWLLFALATVITGFVLHLSWLAFDNWRWSKRMELLAAQSLTPASIAALNKSNPNLSADAVLAAFIKQATQDQRRQGAVTDADFSSMTAKLQQLKAGLGAEVLQELDYDGYGINFEFKAGAVKQSPEQVIAQARMLGLMVKTLGPNRYRLEPYSGLSSLVGAGL